MSDAPKSKRAWQAALGLDSAARQDRDPEDESRVHLGVGWRRTVSWDVNDSTRWWVTAFLTDRDVVAHARANDRVLLRGDVGDFLRGASKLTVIEELLEKGVSVRRLRRLHAKVYASVQADHGVMWIGSANATHLGRGEHVSQNIEAMVGPLVVGPEEVRGLEALWGHASDIDINAIRDEMRRAVDLMVWQAAKDLSNGIVLVRLSVPRPSGRLDIPPDWFDRGDKATMPTESRHTIAYVPEAHPVRVHAAKFAHELTNRLRREGLLREVEGPLGNATYLVDIDDMSALRSLLERADQVISSALGQALAADRTKLEASFIARLEDVLDRLMTRTGYEPEAALRKEMLDDALPRARGQFLGYLDRFGFGVRYALSIPFATNDVVFSQAMEAPQPRSFAVERSPHQEIIREVAEAAGLGDA